ncbi:MAG: carbonic anhydrase [Crocinitomicaceae bacterium]|nr:carbonic anhydrase [Crocinitomicaceae bacterium]
MEKFYSQLLENNKEWARATVEKDPTFFEELSKIQNPPVFWIGCADSRVPANQIVGAKPGDVFVHRNIANMVVHSDMNMLSVLDYAVTVLKVKHVVVCGHYGCGGVATAMSNKHVGIVDNWISHIKDSYRFHKKELDAIEDYQARYDRFVELNVKEQVLNLAETFIIQKAWSEGVPVHIHGWAYSLTTGLVNDLDCTIKNNEMLRELDRFDI